MHDNFAKRESITAILQVDKKNGKTDGIDGKNVNFEAGDRRSIEF